MSGRFALYLAVGLFALPCLAQTLPDRPEKLKYPEVTFKVPRARDFKAGLKNEIPVYLSADATVSPIVSLTINFRGGDFMEPEGREGLAQIYGSQLSQGGSKKMDASKQEDRLEDLAATITSGCDTNGYISMRCLAKDFNEVFGMLFDSLTQPAFAQDRLDLAKRANKQAVERRNDSVTTIAPYMMGHLLRGEKHFSVKYPTTASIDSITRDDLLALHSNILHPSNFVVAISGRFDRKAVLDRLNSTLGSIKPNRMAIVPAVPAPDHARTPGIYIVDKVAPQAMVAWAFPGMRRSDADWHAAAVMNHILGGGFTGRLMKKIRSDEGLTYGIRTTLGEGPHWTDDLTGSAQTNHNTVAYLLRLAIAEMETLKSTPLAEAELQTIKDGLI
jgi:zinc protease